MLFRPKCPHCKKSGKRVEHDTMLHHIKDISTLSKNRYYYCASFECDIVYFNKHDAPYTTAMLNKEIGFKEGSSDQAAVCFCYHYMKSELYNPSIIEKINIRINNYGSRCDIRNPSGKCCLKDIKKVQKEDKVLEEFSVYKED